MVIGLILIHTHCSNEYCDVIGREGVVISYQNGGVEAMGTVVRGTTREPVEMAINTITQCYYGYYHQRIHNIQQIDILDVAKMHCIPHKYKIHHRTTKCMIYKVLVLL